MNSIHSACAAAFARHRGKTGTLHLLQEEIFRLEKAIESVSFPASVIFKWVEMIEMGIGKRLISHKFAHGSTFEHDLEFWFITLYLLKAHISEYVNRLIASSLKWIHK